MGSKKEEDSRILQLDQTKALKGICAIWIMLGHIGKSTALKALWIPWKGSLLIVGVFFFISSYGLTYNLKEKGTDYFKGFLRKRILSIMVPAYIVYLLSGLIILFQNGGAVSARNIILYILFSEFWERTNWFVWEICIFYLLFYLLFQYLDEKKASIVFLGIVILFEIWASLYLKDNQPWYTSTMALPFGILYAQNENWFDKAVRQRKLILVFASLLMIAVTYFASKKIDDVYLVSNFILKNAGTIALIFVVLVVLAQCCIACKLTLWLGKISMEIYLLHLILITPFRTSIQSDVIYAVCVVAVTLILAVPLSFIDRKILKLRK